MRRTALTVAFLVFLSAFVVTITVLPEVKATTLYVGGGGPGNYTTIQAAVDDANPGDTVFIYGGTYHENVKVNTTLSIIGDEADIPVVDGGGVGDVIYVSANGVHLNRLLATNSGPGWVLGGIKLNSVQDCLIEDNIVTDNVNGIYLNDSRMNTIRNNTVSIGDGEGIYLVSSDRNFVIHNNVTNYRGGGIYLRYSRNNTIVSNRASDNGEGVYVGRSANNTVKENNFTRNSWADIGLFLADNNMIENNSALLGERFGIRVSSSNNNTIANNTVSLSGMIGILLAHSVNNTVANNVMTKSGVFISGSHKEEFGSHTIETSNTVNAKPVLYWKDIDGGTIPPGAGQVIIVNSTNVVVEQQNLSDVSVGIELSFSSDITIRDSVVSSNTYDAIYLHVSHNNTIANSTIVNNSCRANNRHGFNLYMSNGNVIADNTISYNWNTMFFGTSNENVIARNNIRGNEDGLYLAQSSNNTITENMIVGTNQTGIEIRSYSYNNTVTGNLVLGNRRPIAVVLADDNVVHHNDFVDNELIAFGVGDRNMWDDGYPSGGNYWSDYEGVDNCSGPNQDNCPDPDGFGDTPHFIEPDSEDRYPRMTPFGSYTPRPPIMLEAHLSGKDFENVTIKWSLSPDDGSGLTTVTDYYISRGSFYNPTGQGYQLLGYVANGTDFFVDNFTGEGDPNNYYYVVTALTEAGKGAGSENQAGKFTHPLSQGPNLVSIPLIQSNESIETVLQTVQYDKAWYYDSSSQEWKWLMTSKGYRRGLWSVNHTMGIWVNITSNCNLTVAGVVPAQTMIYLHKGWNLVGFPSFNATYTVSDLKTEVGATSVEGYDSLSPYYLRILGDLEVLQAGYGYWVMVEADTVWTVEVS